MHNLHNVADCLIGDVYLMFGCVKEKAEMKTTTLASLLLTFNKHSRFQWIGEQYVGRGLCKTCYLFGEGIK